MDAPNASVANNTGYRFDPAISRPTQGELVRRRLATVLSAATFYTPVKVVEDLDDSVDLGNHVITKLAEKDIHQWCISDVALFVSQTDAHRFKENFVNHMIDGKALLMINADQLCSAMKMPLGIAVKFMYSVKKIRKIISYFFIYHETFNL